MKRLAISMVALVMGLSLVPCCSPLAKDTDEKWSVNAADCCEDDACSDEAGNNQSENEGCTSCSPFFSCGSCAGFTFHYDFASLMDMNFIFKKAYSPFRLQMASEYFDTKWQPPKIS